MDPQANSDEEFVVLSTSDYTESPSYVLFVSAVVSWLNFTPPKSPTITILSMEGEEALVEKAVTKVDMEVLGMVLVYISASPRLREASDFRTIQRGNLKLVGKEVVAGRLSRRVGVRRTVYHAEIHGDPGTVTVAIYQGDGAKEDWRRHVAKYELIWHPNIMQLYGLVNTKNLYAMVFHDELIPYAQFLRRFQHLPVLSQYILGYCPIVETTEFVEARSYIYDVIGSLTEGSVWIRPSTGQLSLDLVQGGPETSFELPQWHFDVLRLENVSLDAPDSEEIIISSLGEDQYHELCAWDAIARFQRFQVSTEHAVGPGIFRSDSQHGTWFVDSASTFTRLFFVALRLFSRYDAGEAYTLRLESRPSFWEHGITKAWLAQANRIFAELEEAYVEDCICVYSVQFALRCVPIANKLDIVPQGYLFICPVQDFRTGTEPHAHLYQWPACPAYWSLDPSGADRLSTEDAENLGFPAIHIETTMIGHSWDRRVYEGLRRFHESKGLDPDSREVARRLGYPLLEV
ncbi:Kinase-like protein [Mycena sanguinolenta]|uniref:Kinase-like protein n=1 Tax=Mycena sanguinolenta TaxID=230812 RepID=A0A8H6X9P4_9AGAR|nr:Kinase-like protein [Mycena sanguinolenta]